MPSEATECLEKFEHALSSIEKSLQPVLGVSARQLDSQVWCCGTGFGGCSWTALGHLFALSKLFSYPIESGKTILHV
eukprot:1182878-Prorocentrum_minimum.AAC.2